MKEEILEDEFKALGTQIHIWVLFNMDEENKIKRDIEELKNFYLEKEKQLSRFNPESELNYFNNNLNKFIKASIDFIYLSEKALEYYKSSQRFFDPRIIEILDKIGYNKDFKKIKSTDLGALENFEKNNTILSNDLKIKGDEVLFKKRMDFSGIAKGYITDEGVKLLKNLGWKNFILDSGGDMFINGLNRNKEWEIELEGFSGDLLKLKVQNMAVATSGITRRKWEISGKKFHHLINPKNPNNFSFDLKSVTIISNNTEEADVLAKILFLMGREKGMPFADNNNLAGLFLDYRGNVFITSEARKYI
jgi:FAD:protein FMN transferase